MVQSEETSNTEQPNGFQSQTTPAPDPTQGWETYINQELGFTFKYPADWQTDQDLISINNSCEQITINYKTITNNTLEEYLKEIYKNEYLSLVSNEKMTIGGESSIVINSSGLGEIKTIYVKKNNRVYSLGIFSTDPPNCNGYEYIFSQILSTFQFTN